MPHSASVAADSYPDRLGELWADRYRQDGPPGQARWNETLDTLLAHRSVRKYLAGKPLPEGAIEIAVAAAQSAPTSSNLQLWDLIVVEDSERKARINAVSGNQQHIADAPVLLVWVANLARLRTIASDRGVASEGLNYFESFLLGTIDAALAAQNALVALESLGLGACYIGALRNHPDRVAAELGLPPEAAAIFGMTVGIPDPEAPASVKPRLPQRVIVHREQYSAASRPDFDTYDAILHGFQAEQSMPGIDWTELAARRVADAKALRNRDLLRSILEARGFQLK